jgi:ATP-dependent Clp protease ATP-binding subunit ClpA
MFERFTEKAIKVIMLAQEESRRLGHNFVGTEQVLLGLIGEGTGIAARTLKANGANLKDTRIEVEKIIGRGSGYVQVEIPFTPRAKRLVELAWQESKNLAHNYIGTEHLLLGLLRTTDGAALRVLSNMNILTSTLEGEVMVRLTGEVTVAMFDRFTDKALRVVMLAQEESRLLRHRLVGTEQILLGLIAEDSGIAAQVLNANGVTLKNIRAEVERLKGSRLYLPTSELPRSPSGKFAPAEIPFTPRAKHVIELARVEADSLSQRFVDTAHLLLGIIKEEEGVAVQALKGLSVSTETLRAQLAEEIAKLVQASKKKQELSIIEQSLQRIDTSTFTGSAMHVIIVAREESRQVSHGVVGTEQILLGLLQSRGDAASVLKNVGLDIQAVRLSVDSTARSHVEVPLTIPFSHRASRVILGAWKAARDRRHQLVRSTHLLLALIQQNIENNAVQILKDLRVSVGDLEMELITLLSHPFDEAGFTTEAEPDQSDNAEKLEKKILYWQAEAKRIKQLELDAREAEERCRAALVMWNEQHGS